MGKKRRANEGIRVFGAEAANAATEKKKKKLELREFRDVEIRKVSVVQQLPMSVLIWLREEVLIYQHRFRALSGHTW